MFHTRSHHYEKVPNLAATRIDPCATIRTDRATAYSAAQRTSDAWRTRADLGHCPEPAGGRCARVHASANQATGNREGQRRQAYYENEANEAEFEALGLLRTF